MHLKYVFIINAFSAVVYNMHMYTVSFNLQKKICNLLSHSTLPLGLNNLSPHTTKNTHQGRRVTGHPS